MNRERRLISISTLTLVVFAVSIYLRQGSFVFPIPLNPFIVLIVAIQFAWWNKTQVFPALTMVFIGLCTVLGSEVFWSFIFSDEAMVQFSNSIITDLFSLGALIGLMIYSLSIAIKQNHIITWSLWFLFIILTTCFHFMEFSSGSVKIIFSIAGLVSICISVMYKPVYQPLHLFWIMLLILECTKFVSMIS